MEITNVILYDIKEYIEVYRKNSMKLKRSDFNDYIVQYLNLIFMILSF